MLVLLFSLTPNILLFTVNNCVPCVIVLRTYMELFMIKMSCLWLCTIIEHLQQNVIDHFVVEL
jgi:hypothetical protein